ncbi:MAG: helix-turn-helix domain-containing protein [Actinomycetaceae bacterium]|nr:helix-turn-helix domain-containing protein [Actinomycetaceae bacterium]
MGRWHRTHETLRRAAFELFSERGYEATATAEIAKHAGVSEMTLFRHFPTKEALLLSDPFDPLMADAVRARPEGESAMRALIEGIRQAWRHIPPENVQEMRTLLRIVNQTPHLHGAIERNSEMTANTLIEALHSRGVETTQARIATRAVLAGLSVALLEWAESEESSLNDALTSALHVLGGYESA